MTEGINLVWGGSAPKNDNHLDEISIFHRAISRVEDPRRRGFCITSVPDDECHLVMRDRSSGRLSRYELKEAFADVQLGDGAHWHIGPKEIVAEKLCIIMFNADFGSKKEAVNRFLPQYPGTFEVYSLQNGPSKPILIAASAGEKWQFNLTALGVANRRTLEPLGLRAVFTSNPTPFGVVAVTTAKEHIAMWYMENLGTDKSGTLPTNEVEYDPRQPLDEPHRGNYYEEQE